MKGIWCSINDAGPIALRNLPLMCALTDHVTLWSPSGAAINSWHRQDARLPTAEDILALAENSVLTLGVRDTWLKDDHRNEIRGRNPNIPAFDPGFEGSDRLGKMLKSDPGSRGGARLISGLGSFYEEAERSVATQDELYHRTKEFWSSHARSYVPKATIERIDAAADFKGITRPEEYQELAITILLRDAWLQSELLKLFDSSTALQATRLESITYASCFDQPTISLPNKAENASIDDLTKLIVDLGRASKGPTVERIFALRDKPESLAYFRRIVAEGLSAYTVVLEEEVTRAKSRQGSAIEAILKAAGSNAAMKIGLVFGIAWAILSHPKQIDVDAITTGGIRDALASLTGSFSTIFGLFGFYQLARKELAPTIIDDSTKLLQVLSLIGNDLTQEELIERVVRAL